jgi:hypothetical protein
MEEKLNKKLKDKIDRMKEKLENTKKLKLNLSEELLEDNNTLNLIDGFESNQNEEENE